jgi:hypothetical protein
MRDSTKAVGLLVAVLALSALGLQCLSVLAILAVAHFLPMQWPGNVTLLIVYSVLGVTVPAALVTVGGTILLRGGSTGKPITLAGCTLGFIVGVFIVFTGYAPTATGVVYLVSIGVVILIVALSKTGIDAHPGHKDSSSGTAR